MTTTNKPVLFFGVNSEGMGHATRALPIIRALGAAYDVHVFCNGRAHAFLSQHVPNVRAVWALQLLYADNRLLLHKTIWEAAKTLPTILASGVSILVEQFRLDPVAIVTDYEPISAWTGMLAGKKIVSIDNQQVITFGTLPPPADKPAAAARQVMRNSNFWNHPLRHRVLITSFFQPPLVDGAQKRGVRYVPTTVRPHVQDRIGKTRTDGPVLVYQTSSTNHALFGTLQQARAVTGLSFVVYGSKPGAGFENIDGVTARAFSEEGFVDDMAAAPFVIVNGGHSTINEALALGKPVLAEPIRDQGEQQTNVIGLHAMGVGQGTTQLSVDDIVRFVADLPRMSDNAARVQVANTRGVIEAVAHALAELTPRAVPAAEILKLLPSGS